MLRGKSLGGVLGHKQGGALRAMGHDNHVQMKGIPRTRKSLESKKNDLAVWFYHVVCRNQTLSSVTFVDACDPCVCGLRFQRDGWVKLRGGPTIHMVQL